MAASAGRCDLVCLRHSTATPPPRLPPIIIIIEIETIIIDAIIIIIIIFTIKISTSDHNRQHVNCQHQYQQIRRRPYNKHQRYHHHYQILIAVIHPYSSVATFDNRGYEGMVHKTKNIKFRRFAI